MNEQKSNDLFKIIEENPELPIIPMVNAEIVGDDYGYFMGSWRSVKVDEYIISQYYDCYDCNVIFKSDDDVFEALERCMSTEEFEALPETKEECRPFYDKLPWTKAIIVFIEPLAGLIGS